MIKSKVGRVVTLLIAAFLLLGSAFLYWGEHEHLMGVVQSYDVGDASLPQHVLIATQGSSFKDELVADIVQYLKRRGGVYVKIIDVSALPGVRAADWAAIIVAHTWQFGNPQPSARAFVDRTNDKSKPIVVTTSGGGHQRMPGVDAISAASVDRDVPSTVAAVKARLDTLLAGSAPR